MIVRQGGDCHRDQIKGSHVKSISILKDVRTVFEAFIITFYLRSIL